MRFLPGSPNIPDELLEARDQGDVIFLCGAGVSMPQLPGFAALARRVIDRLGVPSGAPSRVLLERIESGAVIDAPLDQVFQNLKSEYGADYIDQLVCDLLDTPSGVNTEQHSIILKLSRNAAQRPQIVTTNFDLLFEQADPSLKISEAPNLPDLALGQPLEGIVYLHGRRRAMGGGLNLQRSPLVLGSADFGRAYLAEAWATKFVANLLRYYTIVLVGYSANDPPVRYLLQGIHARAEERLTRIYAFDRGSAQDVEARWRDRGVTVISYPESDLTHALLWNTLRAWAERADNVDEWRQSILHLAGRRPSELISHERRQVYALARTDAGAKLFAEGQVPPPAEWLCVFDRTIRYAASGKHYAGEKLSDPLQRFGLDDDPPRPPRTERPERPPVEDLLAPLPHEDAVGGASRLATYSGTRSAPITSRLAHLARWLTRLLDDPVLIWWAAGYEKLHPQLTRSIEWHLEQGTNELPPIARRLWGLLLEKFHQFPRDDFGAPWFPFVREQRRNGWTHAVLREFERVMRPYFTSKRPNHGREGPPSLPWDQLSLPDLAQFDVNFLHRDPEVLSIPPDTLPEVFQILRRGLEQAVGMLSDIERNPNHWQTATFIPYNSAGHVHHDDFDRHLLWIVRLFDRLATESPETARREITYWPRSEPYLFDKFRLYAWRDKALASGFEVAEGILRLRMDAFWNYYQRRELLHALASRWPDMPPESRKHIEDRIISGRERLPDEEEVEYRTIVAQTAARFLGWLQLHDCDLSEAARNRLLELRAAEPEWNPSWDAAFDTGGEARAYSVQLDTDASKVETTPIHELISQVLKRTGRDLEEHIHRDPFRGLVQSRPRRAFLALDYEARAGVYHPGLWKTLLQNWPESTAERLRWAAAAQLVRLPTNVFIEIRYQAADWISKHLPALARVRLDRALKLWDEALSPLLSQEKIGADSGVEENAVPVSLTGRSDTNFERVRSSPIGYLTNALLSIVSDENATPGSGISAPIRERLERLLNASPWVRATGVATMSASLAWTYHIDPEWTATHLLPCFAVDNPETEAAWGGYQYDSHPAGPALFEKLKLPFLDRLQVLAPYAEGRGQLRHLSELLVFYCLQRLEDERYVSYAEARVALQAVTADAREHATWMLVRIVKERKNWSKFGRPFLEQAWPRELRLQTSTTANHLTELAAVQSILPLLMSVDHIHILFNETTESKQDRKGAPKLSQQFPEPFLALLDRLVGAESRMAVHELPPVLKTIAEAQPSLRQDPRWRRLNEQVIRG